MKLLREVARQHLSPAPFGIAALEGLVGHGRVADGENGDDPLLRRESREQQKQAQQNGQFVFHTFIIVSQSAK